MRRLFGIGAITGLLLAMTSICFAATNLNSSRSNIYRLVYSDTLVTQAQAASILADLDRIGRVRGAFAESRLLEILKKHGVQVGNIKKIVTREDGTIILLSNPADLPQALAVSDPRPFDPKGLKPPPPRPFDPKGLPVPPPPRPFDPKGLEGR